MLLPKRVKYRRVKRGRLTGQAKRGNNRGFNRDNRGQNGANRGGNGGRTNGNFNRGPRPAANKTTEGGAQ